MKKSYTGACHCGAVRFQAQIDLDAGTFKCNCEICTKKRMWAAAVQPEEFRLLSGPGALTDYRPYAIHHLFCKYCAVHTYARGENQSGEFYAIMLACLEDVEVEDLVNAPVAYFDGRNDNYGAAPAETRHL